MRIGVAQVDVAVGDVSRNCDAICVEAERAARQQCDMLVFPEMTDTGYEMATIRRTASDWASGRPIATVRQLAAELKLAIVIGLSEREDDRVYNAVAMIDSSGELVGKYRKTHLFTAAPVFEHESLGRGDALRVAELCGMRVGVMVCYDARFPEVARTLALSGAELIVVPAAFPFPRLDHWNALITARAIENQVYVAAANRVGTDGPVTFCGSSRILDPYGTAIASASPVEQTVLIGSIDRDRIAATREQIQVFRDRRSELYGPIASDGQH